MQEDQLFTWEALSAMGGASLLTYFVVQYTKSYIDRLASRRLPTDLYAVIVAGAILVTAQLALGADPHDWRIYMLAVANGFLVAATAGQMQRKAIEPPGEQSGTGGLPAQLQSGEQVEPGEQPAWTDARKQPEPDEPTDEPTDERTEPNGLTGQPSTGCRSDGV